MTMRRASHLQALLSRALAPSLPPPPWPRAESPNPAVEPGKEGGDGKSGKVSPRRAWLSFLPLLVTGGGIIVYYDKEKKRQIEVRLLW
ncbi:hypothetical protein ABZP36_030547 [Zizania latifolia]